MSNQTYRRKLIGSAFAALMALAIVLALGAGAPTFAQTAQTPQTDKKGKAEVKGQDSGQPAAVDPQTGKLRQPTQDDAKAQAEAMKKLYNRSTDELKATHFADGTKMVELTEEYMEVLVFKINPDGSKSVECVTGMKAAEELLKARSAGEKADLTPASPVAKPTQKAATPPVKGETGKAPQKTSQDKSKWEVM